MKAVIGIFLMMLVMADNRLATRAHGTIGVFGRSTSAVVTCARLKILEDGHCLLSLLLSEELNRWFSENIPAVVCLFYEVTFKV